jgi:FkbM family methyltransferase
MLVDGGVVWDVGAYEGAWIKRMYEKYPKCTYYAFEPAPRAYSVLTEKMKIDNVSIHNFGLGTRSRTAQLGDCRRDGASFLKTDAITQAQIVDIVPFMDARHLCRIDLCAINVEGMEFEILPRLTESGYISKFVHLMIQWHNSPDRTRKRQREIQGRMAETHRMMWNHGTWEAWERKGRNEKV